MKVGKLIESLSRLDPNSDILLYNGFTEDWHEISIGTGELVKMKPSVKKQFIVMERFKELGLPFPSKEVMEENVKKVKIRRASWEFNYYASDPKMYNFKTVNLICGKPRGKSSYDRFGSSEY